ncbi:CRISPR-associated protein Csd1 [Desulfofundulus australicus DSM 11792]|uniref:CRISPR-associated protein Csd1 n=1 Tax=Desulfofundulus australicus DSM 11792 TaxID=1121425 RepID=A0A1M5C9W8_9FIRM|nr:type I-C CRISPR-associated protein Cas8c/Csd1 [Desulfofundulus australicus]SHF51564.1 CRISPR-associated protein Csd1 [Desulfofundulus australicus DSM 11792]
MFRELVELGRDLEARGKLPPVGFYSYTEPIRWVVHIWPGPPLKVWLEEVELTNRPRPYDPGRTSGLRALPLVHEAGYALGASKQKNGSDKRVAEKHRVFRELLEKFLRSPLVSDPALREAAGWVAEVLEKRLVQDDPRFGEVQSKDWVSFVPEEGPLAGQHLFEHPEVMAFWVAELEERCLAHDKKGKPVASVGECAICGSTGALIGKLPLQVKLLRGTAPLHCLNEDAFVSYLTGRNISKQVHLGLCFACGDTASRAFDYLSNNPRHRKNLLRDKNKADSLANQIAVYWLKAPAPLQVGDRSIDLEDLLASLGSLMVEERTQKKVQAPPADLAQLDRLLELPWKPGAAGLMLDAYAFYLGVLSPNVGRVALREWFSVSLEALKENLRHFLQALILVSPKGDEFRPVSIAVLAEALDLPDPNLTRGLLRAAYLGYRPSDGLLARAVPRLRVLWTKGRRDRPDEERQRLEHIQALTALLKLVISYGKEDAVNMEELDFRRSSPPYLCGRLLAVLEEAQQRAANFKLNTTLVDRFYGAASTAPASVFGNLLRLSTTAHLPEVGREVNLLVEEILSRLDKAGGFPRTLNLPQQAEFALGFYHQRAYFRAGRGKGKASESNQGGKINERP